MHHDDLLTALARLRINVTVIDGKLRVSPADSLTDDLRAAIREHREALLAAHCEGCGAPTGGYGFCAAHGPFAEDFDADDRRGE